MFLAWGHPIFDCTHTPLNHPYINPSRMYIVIVLLVSFKVGRFISPDVETSFFFFFGFTCIPEHVPNTKAGRP